MNVSSFAGVFPTDGPLDAKRYFVLILVDEPKGSPASGGSRTSAVAVPGVGRVMNRIAPFLGVERKADPVATARRRPWSLTPGRGPLKRGLSQLWTPRFGDESGGLGRHERQPPGAPGLACSPALPGAASDGRNFIPQALANGAVAVIAANDTGEIGAA
jgi:hypothetical protein